MITINIPIVGHYEKKNSYYDWTLPSYAYDGKETSSATIATNMYGNHNNHMYFHAPIPSNVLIENLTLDMLLQNKATNSPMTIDFSITAGTNANNQTQIVAETKKLTMNTQKEKVWFSLIWDSLSDLEKTAIIQNRENLCIEVFVSEPPRQSGDRYMYEIKLSTQAKELFTISTIAFPTNGGSINGSGQYEENTLVTLTATPSPNYIFKQWNDNTVSPIKTFYASQNITYTAYFKPLSSIYIGNKNATEIYVGNKKATAAYLGNNQIL